MASRNVFSRKPQPRWQNVCLCLHLHTYNNLFLVIITVEFSVCTICQVSNRNTVADTLDRCGNLRYLGRPFGGVAFSCHVVFV